jgi:hypothetical protein
MATIQSATVKNTKFMLKFDAELDGKAKPSASDFTLVVDGETVAVHHFKIKGDTIKIFVTGTDKVKGGAVVSLSYTDPTAEDDLNALQTLDGLDVATFLDFSVTNQGKVKPVKGNHELTSMAEPDNQDSGIAVVGVMATDAGF